MISHAIDERAWARMNVFEQMGNIGSEVGRAIKAKKRGKNQWMMSAFFRGIDLINLTAELWAKDAPYRTKELLYARDQFVKTIMTKDEDKTLEQYFFQFALAARKNQ